jgi:fructose-1,6-bisphosphatase II / sedoheptulose-1,7-bisphosphatase
MRLNLMGITDLNKKYELNEIVKGDSIFCASGITSSEVLNGIIIEEINLLVKPLVTHKNSNFKQIIKSINSINE